MSCKYCKQAQLWRLPTTTLTAPPLIPPTPLSLFPYAFSLSLFSCCTAMLLVLPLIACLIWANPGVECTTRFGVFINSAPSSIGSRSGFDRQSAPAAPLDLQRPQADAQQTWNGASNSVRPANGLDQSAAGAVPVTAPDQQRPTVVYGVDSQPAATRPSNSASPPRPEAQFNFRERFSSTLFQPIARDNLRKNMVYSPASVHTMIGLLSTVSSGETSLELQRVGQLSGDKMAVAKEFKRQLNSQKKSENAQLIMANKLFYNNRLAQLNPDYRRFAVQYFESDIDTIDVNRAANSAAKINAWTADATRNRIRNLVSASDIDDQTQALLVNAIYFKARWATEFSAVDTSTEKFQAGRAGAIKVPMMFNDDIFDYADLPELDATAVELPYAGTDASMLIILPNQVDGLAQLESQLASTDLNFIASRLRREMVTLRIPKFRIEFDQDMTRPLQQLGLRRMFTDLSEVDTMLLEPVKVSKILQKAFIDVNEAGSEAAAASCEWNPHLKKE